jgi:hypothetical protein
MSDDLFAALALQQKARLREVGWKEVPVYGTVYWQHPVTGAWLRWEQALEWLATHDQQQEGGR